MGIIYDIINGKDNMNDVEVVGMDTLLERERNLCYIVEHQRNVLIAYIKLFTPSIVDTLKNRGIVNDHILEELSHEIIEHDGSKFSPEEFEFYRRRFFPTPDEQDNTDMEKSAKDAFEIAWRHHYLNNPHHPEYWRWVLPGSTKQSPNYSNTRLPQGTPMDIVSILHMICDWEAMGIKFGTGTMEWYNGDDSKDEREAMHPETQKKLEEILTILYGQG